MRNILITGGTGGIGTALSKEFIKQGDFVIASHNGKDKKFLDDWISINKVPLSKIAFVNCDLTDNEQTSIVINKLLDSHKVDILINNAGVTADSTFLKMTLEDWNNVINVNLLSLFTITQIISRKMVENGKGSIINISSINGLKGQFGQTNYAASKAGIIGFTKSLAQELAIKGVRVNAIAPGYTSTPMVNMIRDDIKAQLCDSIPTKKLIAPLEIAKTAYFIASDISSLTGETISVNGGQYMH
jgi:acetoacetyl-CoA reductase